MRNHSWSIILVGAYVENSTRGLGGSRPIDWRRIHEKVPPGGN